MKAFRTTTKRIALLCIGVIACICVNAAEIVGYYDGSGTFYDGSAYSWSLQVTVDESDPKKVWFSNFAPFLTCQPVYGILSDDETTIQIPVGQLLKDDDGVQQALLESGGSGEKADYHDVSEGGYVDATVTETDGKTVITVSSWYAARIYENGTRSAYWYGGMKLGATLTKNAAVQEAVTPSGLKMVIEVVDETAKTCRIGTGKEAAIASDTEGFVSIPSVLNGYTVIGLADNAFYNCSQVTGFYIPGEVISIGSYAFYNTPAVTSLIVDASNTAYASPNSCNAIIETATATLIAGCQTTKIPATVKTICEGAFTNCPLKSIDIPASVQTIGNYAFSNCKDLASVNIANNSNLKTLDNGAFNGCQNLTSILLPEKLEYIGVQAFAYSGLTSITIPASVTKIDMGNQYSLKTFAGCQQLIRIVVARDNTVYDSRQSCNAIIETATNTLLVGCRMTVIPTGVTAIGDLAMLNLTFQNSVTIPAGVTSIGFAAFQDSRNVTSLELPDGLQSIGNQAFLGCVDLQSVTIPATLTSFGSGAFYRCEKLETVTSLIENPTEIPKDFFSNYDKATLYVPADSKEQYQSTEGWNQFASIRAIGSGPEWVAIGVGRLQDNGFFGDGASCTIYRNSDSPNRYRIDNPYKTIVQSSGQDVDPEFSETIELTILQPGEMLNDVEITQHALVYYPEIKTGFRYDTYNAVVNLLHPSAVKALNIEDAWTFNKVVSYQSSGVPEIIQLAPYYYMKGVGGWNMTQKDDMVLITFPTVEGGEPVKGDACLDGKVDAADVVCLANYIRGRSAGFCKAAADVNGDGVVNIADIMAAVKIIMNK